MPLSQPTESQLETTRFDPCDVLAAAPIAILIVVKSTSIPLLWNRQFSELWRIDESPHRDEVPSDEERIATLQWCGRQLDNSSDSELLQAPPPDSRSPFRDSLTWKDGRVIIRNRASTIDRSGRHLLISTFEEAALPWNGMRQHFDGWSDIFDAMPDHIAVLDMSGAILRANRTLRERFEPKHGRLEGVDYRLLYCGTSTPEPQPPCAAVLNGSGSVSVVTQLPTIDGWFRVSSSPIYAQDGWQWGAISIVQDVTAQENSEAALKERTLQLEELISSSLDGIVFSDETGVVSLWSPRAEEILGWTSDEMVGSRLEDKIIPPESRDQHLAGLELFRKTGTGPIIGQRIEVEGLHRDGRRVPIELSVSSVVVPGRVFVCGSFRDITDRLKSEAELESHRNNLQQLVDRRTSELNDSINQLRIEIEERQTIEQALVSSQSRLRTVIENIPECILAVDAVGMILFANGYPSLAIVKDVVFRNLASVWVPAITQAIVDVFEQVISTNSPTDCVVEGICTEGHRRFASIHMTPVGSGAASEVVVVYRDTTEECFAQEERQANATAQVHLARLSALGEMASSIAHEINQPLYAIANFASAAKRFANAEPRPLDDVIDTLERIANEACRAGDIIHRVRSFAKRRSPEVSEFDLHEAVKAATTLTSNESHVYGVYVAVSGCASPLIVLADRVLIEQVLVNLILNAFQAMADTPPDARRLEIRLAKAGSHVELNVRDHGPGFTTVSPQDAFEPFVTSKSEGTGLGLSISRTLVESCGGRITAANHADGGAEIRISVPLCSAYC